jgi:hypothetical protein
MANLLYTSKQHAQDPGCVIQTFHSGACCYHGSLMYLAPADLLKIIGIPGISDWRKILIKH